MDFKKHEIEAFLVLGEENKTYISGFTGTSSMVLIQADKGLFLTDGRYDLQSKEEVKDIFEIRVLENPNFFIDEVGKYLKENGIKTLGLDTTHISFSFYKEIEQKFDFLTIKEVNGSIEQMRLCKTEEEIEFIKKAVEITDKTFNHCLQFLEEGMTEKQYANKLDFWHKEFGASGPSFDTIVAFGEHSALPHAQPGEKKLQKGDIIKVDYGCFYKGYCSDMTRTFFFGEPKEEELIKIHDIVLEAHLMQIKAVAPGKTTKEIDSIGRDYIAQKGYGDKFIHGTGHGIGLEIHEAPRLNQLTEVTLEEGMAITIEPGIYIEGKGGVRIENDVIVTKDGCEALNKTDRSYNIYNDSVK